MGRRQKYKNGDLINGFTIIQKETVRGFYRVKHHCGRVLVTNTTAIKRQISCKGCKPTGSKHYAWKGCGELPHDLFTTYKHSAIAKKLKFSISIEYLWNLFVSQNRRCALTGEELYFHKTFKSKKDKTASPDRIDSNLGYVEGNIQWIHRDVNKLKKNIPNERFIQICLSVAKHLPDQTSMSHYEHD